LPTSKDYANAVESLMDPLEVYEKYGKVNEDGEYEIQQRDDVMDMLQVAASMSVVYANFALRHRNEFTDLQMAAQNKLAEGIYTIIEGLLLWDQAQGKEFRQEQVARKLTRKQLGLAVD